MTLLVLNQQSLVVFLRIDDLLKSVLESRRILRLLEKTTQGRCCCRAELVGVIAILILVSFKQLGSFLFDVFFFNTILLDDPIQELLFELLPQVLANFSRGTRI